MLHCRTDKQFSVLHCRKDERLSVLHCRKDDAALPERRRCINCHRGAGAHAERAEGQWRTKVSGSKSVADQSHWDQSQWRTKGAGGACCRLLAAMACSRRSVSSHAASSFTANRCPRLSLGHSGSPSSFERRGNGRVTAGNAAPHG